MVVITGCQISAEMLFSPKATRRSLLISISDGYANISYIPSVKGFSELVIIWISLLSTSYSVSFSIRRSSIRISLIVGCISVLELNSLSYTLWIASMINALCSAVYAILSITDSVKLLAQPATEDMNVSLSSGLPLKTLSGTSIGLICILPLGVISMNFPP